MIEQTQLPWNIHETVYLEVTYDSMVQQGVSKLKILYCITADLKKLWDMLGFPKTSEGRGRAAIFQKLCAYKALCDGTPDADESLISSFQLKQDDPNAYQRIYENAKNLIDQWTETEHPEINGNEYTTHSPKIQYSPTTKSKQSRIFAIPLTRKKAIRLSPPFQMIQTLKRVYIPSYRTISATS